MEGLVIGLDLNDDYSQVSCNEKEKSWTVPTVICRRKEKETCRQRRWQIALRFYRYRFPLS